MIAIDREGSSSSKDVRQSINIDNLGGKCR